MGTPLNAENSGVYDAANGSNRLYYWNEPEELMLGFQIILLH